MMICVIMGHVMATCHRDKGGRMMMGERGEEEGREGETEQETQTKPFKHQYNILILMQEHVKRKYFGLFYFLKPLIC